MADTSDNKTEQEDNGDSAAKKKKSGKPLMFGVIAALLLGAASAYAVKTGLAPIPGLEAAPAEDAISEEEEAAKAAEMADPTTFLPLEPLIIALRGEGPRQMRLTLTLETTESRLMDLESKAPRLLDALNTFLRAIDASDLAAPAALDRLRAQMLRRVRLATDSTSVRDVLITEYVIF